MTKINTRMTLYIITGLVLVLIIGAVVLMNSGSPAESVAELLSLGQRFLSELEYEQALVAFLRVIEIEPRNAQGYYGAARAHLGLGQVDEAVEILRLGVEMTGDARLFALLEELLNGGQASGLNDDADYNDAGSYFQAIAVARGIDGPTFAIQPDGSLWAWGMNRHGALGIGTDDDSWGRAKVMDEVVAVSTRGHHAMAIRVDGSLWAWGSNSSGQLGDGTTANRHSPIRIMDNVVYISAGGSYSAAIMSDESLWTWGSNMSGRLGDGTQWTDQLSPAGILDGVVAVSVNYRHGAAIRSDGSLWIWGNNRDGQLGIGASSWDPVLSPVWIMDDVIAVSTGQAHTMAIRSDGSLWGWGRNTWGQLGDGTAIDRHSPVRIMDDVVAVSASSATTVAIRNDGSLWQWGSSGLNEGSYPAWVMDDVVAFSGWHVIKTNSILYAAYRDEWHPVPAPN